MPLLRLKFERLGRGWILADLVARVPALTVPLLINIEKARALPADDQLDDLARAFCISPPSILLKPVSVRDPEETTASMEAGRA